MYDQYPGLGYPTQDTVRMREAALYGTRLEARGGAPAQRPLSAEVAAFAMPATVETEQPAAVTPEMQLLPVGTAQGLGELVAAHAEMTLGGQEG